MKVNNGSKAIWNSYLARNVSSSFSVSLVVTIASITCNSQQMFLISILYIFGEQTVTEIMDLITKISR